MGSIALETLGWLGAAIFFSRFYVQWLASERAGRSVMPMAFWYMSAIGSLMLVTYAILTRSPLGALSQCFNIVVYGRNLVFCWHERNLLTPARHRAAHALMAAVAAIAIVFTINTWLHEYHTTQAEPNQAATTWFWLAVGLVGQVLFAGRSLIQWVATERQRRSVVPTSFWYVSAAAAALQLACYTQRHEWVFAAGMITTLLIYLRNIALLLRHREKEPAQ